MSRKCLPPKKRESWDAKKPDPEQDLSAIKNVTGTTGKPEWDLRTRSGN